MGMMLEMEVVQRSQPNGSLLDLSDSFILISIFNLNVPIMLEINSNAPALFLLSESSGLEGVMSSVHILYVPFTHEWS